jgi:hypothetical protein
MATAANAEYCRPNGTIRRLRKKFKVPTHKEDGETIEEEREWGSERHIRQQAVEIEGWPEQEIEIYREDELGYRRIPDAQKIRVGRVHIKRKIRGTGTIRIEIEGNSLTSLGEGSNNICTRSNVKNRKRIYDLERNLAA